MQLSDFDFDLPDDLIATRPMVPRSAAKLLFADGDNFHDKTVGDLIDLFQAGDRLVLNNTRVIPARPDRDCANATVFRAAAVKPRLKSRCWTLIQMDVGAP
jgi:S-adenosylmethionine:tRNA-ribosyltransferase-isomerase (queuine synthetase)